MSQGKSEVNLEIIDRDGVIKTIGPVIVDDNLYDSETMACIPCAYAVIVAIVEIIADADQDDFTTACRKGAEQLSRDCVKAGGKPNLKVEDGWFSDTCEFSCK